MWWNIDLQAQFRPFPVFGCFWSGHPIRNDQYGISERRWSFGAYLIAFVNN